MSDQPSSTKPNNALLTAEEVAAMLSVSVRQVYRLDERGILPAKLKVGGSVRWREADLLEWVAGGCIPANEDTL